MPISEELHVLRVTVGRDFVADLDAARNALSHQIPDRNLEKVLHECMRHFLREKNKRRMGTGRILARKQSSTGGRYIPTNVRKQVWERDRGCCAFVSDDGRRCGSFCRVEVHHIQAFGLGGPPTVENLALRCSSHNLFHAVKDYGPDLMARVTRGKNPSS